MHKKRK